MGLGRARLRIRSSLLSAALCALAASGPARAEEAGSILAPTSAEAASIFHSRCTACHTYGKGVKVGPDLKGATGRRERRWLVRFIHGSSSMIASGDPTAVALFAQFQRQRMPDWTDLSETQIEGILDYLAAGGPDVRPLDERSADKATAADVELGRRLFDGVARFTGGAQPCSSCHGARGSARIAGGSLGPDLTAAYLRYQDKALTSFLRRPCLRWDAGVGGAPYLTPGELFALKAFLWRASLPDAPARDGAVATAARHVSAATAPREEGGRR